MIKNLTCFFFFLLKTLTVYGLQVSALTYTGDFQPGESRDIKLTLINERDVAEKVDLQICDYACNCKGEHFYEEPGKMKRTNASWITLNQEHVTLEPKDQYDVFYTITAPKDPDLGGSFWSVLLIEPADPVQQMIESESGYCVNVKIRYAHHIVTNLGKRKPKLKIIQKEINELEGKKYLSLDVDNVGELFVSPKLMLKLYDSKGNLKSTLEGQSERLYPGNSQRYLLAMDGVEAGKYTGFLLLDNGDNNLFGDTFPIQFP